MNSPIAKAGVPAWIADMLAKVRERDFAGASAYFTDDCDAYFAHVHCRPGGDEFVALMSAFESQFAECRYELAEGWDGSEAVMFGGMLRLRTADGTVHETPYWSRLYKASPGARKIARAYFMCSFAHLPGRYWQHLDAPAQAA